MNLPNGLTVGRIAATPLVAVLPFVPSSGARLGAFLLFVAAAVTDWFDGYLARVRKEETNLGRVLDPLADKMLLVGTFVPMYFLQHEFPFKTPIGDFGLPWWVVAIILGREVTMTWFRQYASRGGVIIASIWPAKWKTAISLVWQGSAYFWFWLATLARQFDWPPVRWHRTQLFVGSVGSIMMAAAIVLTLYSLYIYMRDYGYLLRTKPAAPSEKPSARTT